MKLKISYKSSFLTLFTIFFLFLQVAQSQESEIAKIKENFEQKHYELCIQTCNELLKKTSNLSLPYYYRAKAFYQQEKYNNALRDFDKFLELDPKFIEAYAHRGACKKKLNQEFEACLDWRTGLEKGDNKSKELFDLHCQKIDFSVECRRELQKAEELIAKKEFKKVIPILDKAEFLDPKEAKTFLLKGRVQKELKNTELAIFYIEKAIQLNPDYTQAYNTRAKIFMEEEDYVLAYNDWNTSLKQDDKQMDLYFKRGICSNKINKYSEAIADFDIFLTKNPKNVEALSARAEAHKAIKNDEKALADFESILAINPLDSIVLYKKALILFDFGQTDQACRAWQQAYYLGSDDSEKAFQSYCEASPKTAKNLQQKAIEKMQTDNFVVAKLYLDKSIHIHSKDVKSFYYRGLALFKLQKYTEAIKDLNTYLQLNFSDGQAFYYRGLAYKNLQKLNLACKDLTEAQTLGVEVNTATLQQCCQK